MGTRKARPAFYMTATTVSTPTASRTEIARLLSAILATRFVINTAFRIGYAFAPELSRGLGVDLEAWSTLVGVRSGMGVFAPVFGALSDRVGRRTVMLGGSALFVGCALLAYLSASPLPFALGFVGIGLTKVIFEPSALVKAGVAATSQSRGYSIASAILKPYGSIEAVGSAGATMVLWES